MEPKQIKFRSKKEKEIFEDLIVGENPEKIKDPCSGKYITLDPVAASLYKYIKSCQLFQFGVSPSMMTALRLFKRNWPKEYSIFFD